MKNLFGKVVDKLCRSLLDDKDANQFVKNQSGIYALFYFNKRTGKYELHYVGKALGNLHRRIKAHLKDSHKNKWTHFSAYLVLQKEYVGKLEAFAISIGLPPGNKAQPIIGENANAEIIQAKKEVLKIVSGGHHRTPIAVKKKSGRKRHAFENPYTEPKEMRFKYKGEVKKAILLPSGKVRYKGKSFPSPFKCAKYITEGRGVTGVRVWHIQNANGDWIPLNKIS